MLCFAELTGTGILASGSSQGTAGSQRLIKVGTHGFQRENHRLLLQGTAGSQRLELLIPTQPGHHGLQLQAIAGSQNWI